MIKSTETEKNHTLSLTRWCHGLARKELKDTVLNQYPTDLFKKQMNSIDMELLKEENNLQGLPSYDSYRKVRSEKLNENRQSNDDIEDLKINRDQSIKNNEEEYIHEILDPFAVYLYSQSQFTILKQEIKKRKADFEIVLHIDATGAVVRKPYDCSQIYYYVAIIKAKSAEFNDSFDFSPVMEMISSSHDVISIGNWLRTTKERVGHTEKWLDRVVSDMSFATINCLCDIFKQTNYIEYLNITHRWMINKDTFANEKKIKTVCALLI